ncbi:MULTISPECIES: TraR/DksA C4-type zinc finger protein [Salinisphaera]
MRCVECDEPIPVRRRELPPGVQRCVDCARSRNGDVD